MLRQIHNCPFAEMGDCKLEYCIGTDCSLYEIKNNKSDIEKKIKEELQWIQNHKKEKEEVRDRTQGIIYLAQKLEKHNGKKISKFRSLFQIKKMVKQCKNAKTVEK